MEPLLVSKQRTSEYICPFCFSLESGDLLETRAQEKVIIRLIILIKSIVDVICSMQMLQIFKEGRPALSALAELVSSTKGFYTG